MSKKTPFLLQIPQPCQEAWEEMQPVAGGRFCAHCQKCVTDITAMSDRQLVALMQENPQGLCVRALSSQLHRPIHWPVQEPTHFYRLAIALGLSLVLLGAGEAYARPHPPLTEQYNLWTMEDSVQTTQEDSIRFSGVVLDEYDSSFAGALIKLTQDGVMISGTITEDDGTFELVISSKRLTDFPLKLEFFSIAYKIHTLMIHKLKSKEGIEVRMSPAGNVIGGEVVIILAPEGGKSNKTYNEKQLKQQGF